MTILNSELYVTHYGTGCVKIYSVPEGDYVRDFICVKCWSICNYNSLIFIAANPPKKCYVFTPGGILLRNFSINYCADAIIGQISIINDHIYRI